MPLSEYISSLTVSEALKNARLFMYRLFYSYTTDPIFTNREVDK